MSPAGATAGTKQAEQPKSINEVKMTRREYFTGELARDFNAINLSLVNAETNLDLDTDLTVAARDALSIAQSLLIKALA